MGAISYKLHRFPPDVIRYAVWLYFRFTRASISISSPGVQTSMVRTAGGGRRCWGANVMGNLG